MAEQFFPDPKSDLSLKEQYEQWKREHPEEEKPKLESLLDKPTTVKDPWATQSKVNPQTQEMEGPLGAALDKIPNVKMKETPAPKPEASELPPEAKAAAIAPPKTAKNVMGVAKAAKKSESKGDGAPPPPLPEKIIDDPVEPKAKIEERKQLEAQRDAINEYYQKAQMVMGLTELASTVAQMAALWGAANSKAGQAMSERLARTPSYDYQGALANLIRSKQADLSDINERERGIATQEAGERQTWKEKLDAIQQQRALAERKAEKAEDVKQRGLDRASAEKIAGMRTSHGGTERAPKTPSLVPLTNENARLQKELDQVENAIRGKQIVKEGKTILTPEERDSYEKNHGWLTTDAGEMEQILNDKASKIRARMEANSQRMEQLAYGSGDTEQPETSQEAAPVTVTSEAEWKALAPGTKFVDGSGKVKVKK